MTEREQWRFQWPDGTWIRWNPQTQSWEKEDHGDSGSRSSPRPSTADSPRLSAPAPGAAERAAPPPQRNVGWQPVARDPSPPVLDEPHDAPGSTAVTEAPRTTQRTEGAEEIRPEPASVPRSEPVRQQPPARAARPTARDVLPAADEPDRPGGSLWPTVIAGAVVGVGVGLLLSAVIR